MVIESITISSVGELGLAFFFPWSFEHHIKMILVHKYLHPHTDDGSPSKHSFCGDACTNRISLVLSPKLRLPKVQMRALEWKNDWVGSYKACWNMGRHDLPWVACAFARSCSAGWATPEDRLRLLGARAASFLILLAGHWNSGFLLWLPMVSIQIPRASETNSHQPIQLL